MRLRRSEVQVALATVLLDRHRIDDALARARCGENQDDRRPDIYTLQALAYRRIGPSGRSRARAAAGHPLSIATIRDALHARTASRPARSAGRRDQGASRLAACAAKAATNGPASPTAGAAPFDRVDLLRQVPGVAPIFPQARYADGYAALRAGDYARAVGQFNEASANDPIVVAIPPVRERVVRAASAIREGRLDAALQDLQQRLSPTHRTTAKRIDCSASPTGSTTSRGRASSTCDRRSASRPMTSARGYALRRACRRPAAGRSRARADAGARRRTAVGAHPLRARAALRAPIAAAAGREELSRQRVVRSDRRPRSSSTVRSAACSSTRPTSTARWRRTRGASRSIPTAARRIGSSARSTFFRGATSRRWRSFSLRHGSIRAMPGRMPAAGQVQVRLLKYADAAVALQRALSLDPNLKEARYALGTSLMRLGKTEEARKELETFARQQAEAETAGQREFQLDALRREGSRSLLAGAFEQAIASYDEALELDPDNARSRRDLGLALLRAKRPQEAVEHLEAAQRLEQTVEGFCVSRRCVRRCGESRRERTSARALTAARSAGEARAYSGACAVTCDLFNDYRCDRVTCRCEIPSMSVRTWLRHVGATSTLVSATAILVRAPTRVQLVAPTSDRQLAPTTIALAPMIEEGFAPTIDRAVALT